MKKVLSIVLAVVMLCSSFAGVQITSMAADLPASGSCGPNVTYTFDSSIGLLTISGTGAMTNYSSYSDSPFSNNLAIRSVIIGNNITSISNYSFYGCKGINELTIPCSTKIGFYNDNVGYGNLRQYSNAFTYCTNIEKITITEGNGTMVQYGSYMAGLSYNGDEVNTLLYYKYTPWAVSNSALHKVIIENGVKNISRNAFRDCTALTSITIPDSVNSIDNAAFSDCTGLTNIFISDSVSSIGSNAFKNCTGLMIIRIPDSVKSIESSAFSGCNSIVYNGDAVGSPWGAAGSYSAIEGDYAYNDTEKTKLARYLGNESAVVIPDSVVIIDESAFLDSKDLASVIITDNVKSIGNSAFRGCSSLSDLSLPNSIESIGDNAFQGCTALSDISFSTSLTSIGSNAFNGCISLLKVDFPDSLSTLGNSAFEGCTSVKTVNCGNGLSTVPNRAFYGNGKTTSVYIGNSVTSIGNSAFYNNAKLSNVVIGNAVSDIQSNAFYGCSSMLNLSIPASATVDQTSFANCSGIKNITITPGTGTMKTFNSSSYSYTPWHIARESLETVSLEEGITSIGTYAFYNNSGIREITIPLTVTKINNMAFNKSCLTDIKILNGDCNIYDTEDTLPSNAIIHSVPGGTVQEYAQEYSRAFECLEHTLETQVAKDPTCTETGLTEGSHCTVCGKVLSVQETIDALGHDYGNGVVTKEPTCILDGEKTFTCSRCGDTYTETIDALGHTYDSGIITRPATCSQKGEREYTCVVCGDKYTEEIAMTEHTPEIDSAVAATCEKAGLTEGSHCSVCGKVLIAQEVVNATGHSFNSTITTPATCTAKGIRTYTCSICGVSYNEEIDMISHMPAIDAAVAATCTKTGLTEGSHCSVCGKVITAQKVIYSTGHSYVKEVTAPTCKDDGYTTYTCSVCGDSYKADYTEVTMNHNYQSTVTTPATCTEEGIRTYTCSICGDRYTKAISMISHKSVTDNAVASTCTKAGLTSGSHCSVCGYVITDQAVVPANGHSYNAVITAPTCKDKGYTTHTCTVCGDSYVDSYTDVSDAHDYKATITTPATCSKEGVKTFTCSVCGDKHTESIPMIAHTPVIDKAVASTCTKAGLTEGSHCSVCGYVIEEQDVVPATGHTYNAVVTEPTCKDKGYTTHTCTVCGDKYIDSYTQTTQEHDYKATINTPASCSKQGVKTFTCSICGDKYTEAIAMTEHTPTADKAVAPTCTKAGLTAGSHCSVCGYVIVEQAAVSARSHSYTASVTKDSSCSQAGVKTYTCTICGDKYTEAIPLKTHTVVSDNAVAPTCTKYGLSAGKYCSVCGRIFETQEKIEPLGHDFGSVVTPATLTANGVITHPCSRCDKAAASEVIYAPKTFALAKSSYVYTGKPIAPVETVKDSKGKTLAKGIDYTVVYKNNKNIGTASAVITLKGNYKGTKTLAFTILPKGTNLALAGAKKAFTAKWTKVAGVAGYQIQYATNAKFTGAKAVTVKGASKYAQAVKNLKGGARYYVRIRTYKTVGGKNYFSAWSAAKAVTTKK